MDLLDATNFALDRILDSSKRIAVSSAIPSSEVAGTGRHSQDETGPEVLGGFPPADRGPATVGVLSAEHRAHIYKYERLIEQLYDLARAERFDELHDVVRAEYLAIHGPQS